MSAYCSSELISIKSEEIGVISLQRCYARRRSLVCLANTIHQIVVMQSQNIWLYSGFLQSLMYSAAAAGQNCE